MITYELAILDTDSMYIQNVKAILHQYENLHGMHFEISVFPSAIEFFKYPQANLFHIILLGTNLSDASTTEVLKHLTEHHFKAITIIAANDTKLAYTAMSNHAAAYLLKPIIYDNIEHTLDRILPMAYIQKMVRFATETITIKDNGHTFSLPVSNILYFEKYRNNLTICTEKQCYKSRYTIKELIPKLDPTEFVKISQGCIVNWRHVVAVQDHVIIVGKKRLAISGPFISAVHYQLCMHPLKRLYEDRGKSDI